MKALLAAATATFAMLAASAIATPAGIAKANTFAPPNAGVNGKYTFTMRVTNTTIKPGVLDVTIPSACKAPCSRFTTNWRVHGRPKVDPGTWKWKWNGHEYVYGPQTSSSTSSCLGRNKRDVQAGYEIVSKLVLIPGPVKGGRIASFRGTGRDDYRLTAKGLKAGCKPGAYVLTITAVTP
jgi:hypothetical protein